MHHRFGLLRISFFMFIRLLTIDRRIKWVSIYYGNQSIKACWHTGCPMWKVLCSTFQEENLNIVYFISGTIFLLLPVILLSLWNIIRDTFSSDEDGIQRFLKGINGWQMKCRCGFLWIIAYFIGILCLSFVAYLLLVFSAIFYTFCEWLIGYCVALQIGMSV